MKNYKKFWIKNILIFLFLVTVVTVLQFTLLNDALNLGFKTDDRIIYFGYKILGPNPLSKIAETWNERGLHTSYQVYYFWLLENLVGFNYKSFHIVSVFFKALATIAVFPAVLIIFKNKRLAFLTTIFYSLSHASVGALEYVVKGSDYLAIFFMCMFLIVYYMLLKNHKRNLILLGSALGLLILTLISSPIRLYPLLILLPLIEMFLILRDKKLANLKEMLIRMSVLYSPFIGLTIISPQLTFGYLQTRFGIYNRIIEGNWHLILSPFSGIGAAFVTSESWGRLFGLLKLGSFAEYLVFLSGGPVVVFAILTIIAAIVYTKKPWPFISFVFTLNFLLDFIVFFLANHYKYLPNDKRMIYDTSGLYPALLGIYISVLGVALFLVWLKSKRSNNILFASWTGFLFLFIFVFATWSLEPSGINFSSTSYHLVVASSGSSLILSAFLLAIYNKIMHFKEKLSKAFLLFPLLIFIIFYFLASINEIRLLLNSFLQNGRAAEGQRLLQERFKQKIKGVDLKNPTLFYFDTSEISSDGTFYGEAFLSGFPYWMFFEGNVLKVGCTEILSFAEHNRLREFIKEDNGQKVFFYRSLCVSDGKSSYRETFYKLADFHAFKLKNKDFIDIKQTIIEELELMKN